MSLELKIDLIFSEFRQTLEGRTIATVTEAAKLVRVGQTAIRDAVNTGELLCSRRSKNGRIHIHCRELARWFVAGEKNAKSAVDTKGGREDD